MNGSHVDQTAPSLTALRVIHLGMTTSLVPLAVVAGFLGPDRAAGEDHPMDALAHAAIVVVVFAVPSALFLQTLVARRVANKREEALQQLEAGLVPGKMAAACTIAWGLIQGAGIFGGVIALITGIIWAVAAPIAAFIVLAAMRPTERGLRSLAESV